MSAKSEKKRLRKLIMERAGIPYEAPDLGNLTQEEKYLEFIDGLRIEFDFKNYPDYLFFFRDQHCPVQYNMVTKELFVSGEMWTTFQHIIFEDEANTEMFITRVFKESFHLQVRPKCSPFKRFENFKKQSI